METLPASPVKLTAAQAEAMSQRMIKKHDVAIILLHWLNAITWAVELATGAALISSAQFRFAPSWYIEMVTGVFGTRQNMLRFHIAAGIAWIAVFAVYGLFGRRTYLKREILEREIGLDRDDFDWLRIRLLLIAGKTKALLPPQGVYNAGQKLFAVMVYMMIPVVMGSGLVMAFHWGSAAVVGWAIVVHFMAVTVVVSGLMIHVYMGAVFPEEKPAFFSMLTGMVNELFAYKHHFKWWREVKMEELAWQARLDSGEPHTDAAKPAPGRLARALRMNAYWPPYVAGFGLGLTLLLSFLVMGQGLGASGGFTRWVAWVLTLVSPEWTAQHGYWGRYAGGDRHILFDFLVFETIGVALGGFVSGWLAGRLKLQVEGGPRISPRTRLMLAFAGGTIAGIGARLARGCTSGLALSGGATLSAGAFIFMLPVFAAGFIGAYFLRRIWL
ncbi:MAG TPA: YeeE/YedE thiosulfate transporter family protein [Bryobacteraceae bacterium]|nr:YeeE/YedE thiosulfate transporter family protein [Bryobacteraceae bacterium]